MPHLCVRNLKRGVIFEVGPTVRVVYDIDDRGRPYLKFDAPADFDVTRRDPTVSPNDAVASCLRCRSWLRAAVKRCGACGRDLGGS